MNMKVTKKNVMTIALFMMSTLDTLRGVQAETPVPLEKVDVAAYLGRWFQSYASFTVKYSFELGGNCVTADYSTTDINGTIAVTNIVRPFGGDFLKIPINGFAVQSPDENKQGALTVSLGPAVKEPEDAEFEDPGNYWIFALGPIIDDKYQWSLVTNDNQRQLYVLNRDPENFETVYAEDVLKLAEEMGFTNFLNKPRRTNQRGCDYDSTNVIM
jgi:lipocalin